MPDLGPEVLNLNFYHDLPPIFKIQPLKPNLPLSIYLPDLDLTPSSLLSPPSLLLALSNLYFFLLPTFSPGIHLNIAILGKSFPTPIPKWDQSTLLYPILNVLETNSEAINVQVWGIQCVPRKRHRRGGISLEGLWEEPLQGVHFPGYEMTTWFTQTPQDSF